MLPESNPKKSCRGSHHALRLHRNLLQSQAPPLSARLSLPTRVRKTLEQSNKPTKLNNCLSAFSKTDHNRLATLTPREFEVLKGVIAGRLNKQIASQLGTTEGTIKVHRGRVMEEMGATSVADLVVLAQRAGIAPTSTDATKV